ncbi:MAG: hypothetical protein ACI94Y_001753 [Maribacter sp.]|jgi:hypothetical protein
MKQTLIIISLLLCTVFMVDAQEEKENVIKDTYMDKMNGQTTVIIKDSTTTDLDILDQLDMDNYTVGQEVRITEDMITEMNRRARMERLIKEEKRKLAVPGIPKVPSPDKFTAKGGEDMEPEVIDIGVTTPSTQMEAAAEENAGEMIQVLEEGREGEEGEEIFIRKNPAPVKFLELQKTPKYQEKLRKLQAQGVKIFV